MLNRILYWFITLPMLAKSGCLGVVGVVFVCSCLMLATIPGANARIAQQATQTAVSSHVQATEAGVARAATSAVQSTALVQAQIDATATRIAQVTALVQAQIDATATSAAAARAATEAANSGVTATAQAAHQATDDANAAAAIEQATAAAIATAVALPTATPIPDVAYTELDRWERDGRVWVAIRIKPGVAQADLLRLAQQLRVKDPSARYSIFDDATQIKQFKNWSLHDTGYPEAWVQAHYIAMINEIFDSGKLQWQLLLQQGSYASFPVEITVSAWGGNRGDGSITSEEAAGWAAVFMQQTKTYACCTAQVQVTAGRQSVVTITLDGELATRPEAARQMIASAANIRFQAELGECVDSVMFVDTKGSPIGDSYTPTRCG